MENEAAEEHYREALVEDPEDAEARRGLAQLLGARGCALQERGRIEAAIECYEEALALEPSLAPAHNNLGNAYRALGRHDEALACFREALALDPGQPEAHLNLGIALHQSGARDEAAAHYRAALAARPGFADASRNLGYLLEQEGDWQGARERYCDAVAARPDDAEAHFNLALNLLAGGDFAAGWREYEWRLRLPALAPHWPFQGRTRWDGAALDGRTILLYAEQGFGDALQFVRYAPLVARSGGRVVLACQPELRELFARIPGMSGVVSSDQPMPPFDLCCSLLSLPRILGTTLDGIPAEVPYLCPDPERVRFWQARLAADGSAVKVGLAWTGNPRHAGNRDRAIPVELLAPLEEVFGVALYSLQMGVAPGSGKRALPRLIDVTESIADFSDTAAIVAQLDVVISIDSAIAHLAGALGKPVWTLLPYPSEWRWLRERDDSPWYPSMRLFRQKRPREWGEVVQEAARALSIHARGRQSELEP